MQNFNLPTTEYYNHSLDLADPQTRAVLEALVFEDNVNGHTLESMGKQINEFFEENFDFDAVVEEATKNYVHGVSNPECNAAIIYEEEDSGWWWGRDLLRCGHVFGYWDEDIETYDNAIFFFLIDQFRGRYGFELPEEMDEAVTAVLGYDALYGCVIRTPNQKVKLNF